jgi:CubicO group peptidase (beta-lactamase class C family)
MVAKELKRDVFRTKVLKSYDKYLNISDKQKMAIGIYKDGKCYVFGNGIDVRYMYDIGSISKTMTAHLILKYVDLKIIGLNDRVDKYLKLKYGIYPTINELLTHSAGYSNLTPLEFTLPNLIKNGYSKRNIYEKIVCNDVIKALERRRKIKYKNKYGYSDFAYAVLALVAEKVSGIKYSELLFNFIRNDLLLNDTLITLNGNRQPLSVKDGKVLSYWKWNLNNPYIASGGVISNIYDMLKYISLQIESKENYVVNAHKISEDVITKNNLKICKGWHTYEKSHQLWHVGGVGTFRSSIIVNKHNKIGVVVLGNTKGIPGANVHYLAKMIYSELKIRKIKL